MPIPFGQHLITKTYNLVDMWTLHGINDLHNIHNVAENLSGRWPFKLLVNLLYIYRDLGFIGPSNMVATFCSQPNNYFREACAHYPNDMWLIGSG